MEGNRGDGTDAHALGLFVAAAWWMEHRKGAEPPRQILRAAIEFARGDNIPLLAVVILAGLATLLGPEAEKQLKAVAKKHKHFAVPNRRTVIDVMAALNRPFEARLHERRVTNLSSALPIRRAEDKIGVNAPCPCGSGKKHKRCCWEKAQARLRDSSHVPGVTRAELEADPHIGLSEARIQKMRVAEVLALDPLRLPEEMQWRYLLMLGIYKQHDKIAEVFYSLGVPEHLHKIWSQTFLFAIEDWQPELARKLLEAFPDAEEKLGVKVHAGIRALLVGDDPAKLIEQLRQSAEAGVKAGDVKDLTQLAVALLNSPYRAVGILFARGLLPIVDEDLVEDLYDCILAARAKLDLSPDDEFSEWMNEKALRKAREHETAAVQEAQDKLALTAREARRAKETNARLEREIALLKRKEHSRDEAKASTESFDPALCKIRELVMEKKQAQALAREKGEAELKARRELERLTKENEVLKNAVNGGKEMAEEEEEGREEFEVSGKQPVRLIAFPRSFRSSLANAKGAAARAAMNRLGRIAAGEAAAFDKLKAIVALPGVIEARVSDRYRLFFSLLPNCVRVVDLIYRPDMDKKIEHYKLAGLPPVPEFE
jgi:SEC-C motif